MKRLHKVGDIVWYVSNTLTLKGVVQRVSKNEGVIVFFENEFTGMLDTSYGYNIYSPDNQDKMVFVCGQ